MSSVRIGVRAEADLVVLRCGSAGDGRTSGCSLNIEAAEALLLQLQTAITQARMWRTVDSLDEFVQRLQR